MTDKLAGGQPKPLDRNIADGRVVVDVVVTDDETHIPLLTSKEKLLRISTRKALSSERTNERTNG